MFVFIAICFGHNKELSIRVQNKLRIFSTLCLKVRQTCDTLLPIIFFPCLRKENSCCKIAGQNVGYEASAPSRLSLLKEA